MRPGVLSRLRCPRCADSLTFASDGRSASCPAGHPLTWRSGYLDASVDVDDELTARTFRSFGYEWNKFDDLTNDDQAYWQEYFADVPLKELAGKVGLDAGCGKGRYSRYTAEHLADLVALDGSDAVVAAVRNLADRDNVTVVRGDLRHPPFAAESFDFISCLGVLHHLADPREGFEVLVRMLAPGGVLLIYLYSYSPGSRMRSAGLRAAAALRRITVRTPHWLLRPASAPLAALLYGSFVLPGLLGERFRFARLAQLPLAAYRGRSLHTLWIDTFDRLSAPVEHRFTWPDIEPWFEQAGLAVEGRSLARGLTVVARKIG